jgi:hypothetical protein
VTHIRVILVETPRLVGDIVEELIARESDIELVGTIRAERDLAGAVKRTRADVILCHVAGAALPPAYRGLFEMYPHLKVLAIEASGRTGFVYELRPVRAPLEVWPQGLVDAIRSAGASDSPFSWIGQAQNR